MATIMQELLQHLSVDIKRGMEDNIILPYWSAKMQQVGLPFNDASGIISDIREGLSPQAILAYWEAKLKLQCPDAIIMQPETAAKTGPSDWQNVSTAALLTEFRRIAKFHSYTSITNRLNGGPSGNISHQLVSSWAKGSSPDTHHATMPSNFRAIRKFVDEYNQGDHSGLYPPGKGRKAPKG